MVEIKYLAVNSVKLAKNPILVMSMKPAKRIIHFMLKYRLWPGIIYLDRYLTLGFNLGNVQILTRCKRRTLYYIQMARRPKIMRYYNSLAIFILILDQLVKWFQSRFYTQHAFALCKPFCGVNCNVFFI